MKLCFTTIKVKNMDASLNFYVEVVGLKEIVRFSPRPGMDIAFLSDGENGKIELIESKGTEVDTKTDSKVSIGFGVESIDDTIKLLQSKNIPTIGDIVTTPTGEKFIYVSDPDGVEVEFIEGFRF